MNIDKAAHIIDFQQMPATGWKLGVIIPEHDLLASVQTTQETLITTEHEMVGKFVWFAIAFLPIAIAGTLALFNRRFMRPIQALIQFTREFTKGSRDERIHLKEKEYRELGPLSGEEKKVLVVFAMTAFLWIFRKDLNLGFAVIPGCNVQSFTLSGVLIPAFGYYDFC